MKHPRVRTGAMVWRGDHYESWAIVDYDYPRGRWTLYEIGATDDA